MNETTVVIEDIIARSFERCCEECANAEDSPQREDATRVVTALAEAGYVIEPLDRVQQLEGERDRAFALMAEMDRVINHLRTQLNEAEKVVRDASVYSRWIDDQASAYFKKYSLP